MTSLLPMMTSSIGLFLNSKRIFLIDDVIIRQTMKDISEPCKNIKYEPSIQSDQYRRQMRSFDHRGASPSPGLFIFFENHKGSRVKIIITTFSSNTD